MMWILWYFVAMFCFFVLFELGSGPSPQEKELLKELEKQREGS